MKRVGLLVGLGLLAGGLWAGEKLVLMVNEDNDHYFKQDKALMTEEALKAYIDSYAHGKVTHFVMCPSGQRPSYDSKVWEPIWAGCDPGDYRTKEGTNWTENCKLLWEKGIDPYAVWIKRCREKGISPWISPRMNDTHFAGTPNYFRNTTFWRTRRDLWREPEWKASDGGNGAAFDFSKAEARKWILDLIKEQIDRWDVDGVEMDWMRCWQHLTPGKEVEQSHYLTDMVRTVRGWTEEAAKRRGHPVKLGVRVPSDPEAARLFGVDAVGWAKAGLVDQIVASCFWRTGHWGTPIAEWRRRLGEAAERVALYPCTDGGYGCVKSWPKTMPESGYRGWADTQLAKGVKGLYLFNLPYTRAAVREWVCRNGLDAETVRKGWRIYPATYDDVVPKGYPDGQQLPIAQSRGGVVRLVTGKTAGCAEAVVVLAAKEGWGDAAPAVKLNGVAAVRSEAVGDLNPYRVRKGDASAGMRFHFPAGAVKDLENVVEIGAVEGAKSRWTWCQMEVK